MQHYRGSLRIRYIYIYIYVYIYKTLEVKPSWTPCLKRLISRSESEEFWFPLLFSQPVSLTLCDPMDCSTPGPSVPHHFPKFAQVHVHCISDAIQPSHPLRPFFSFCPQSFLASGTFPMSHLLASDDQNTGVSTSVSVLPMRIQDWFTLRLTLKEI